MRSSFTVYVVASHLDPLAGLSESLAMAGYMVARFNELPAAFSEFQSNPPHFLLFDSREKSFDLPRALQQVRAQLPESHIFLVVPIADRPKAVPYLEHGVQGLIYLPVIAPIELLSALDRAAERDYFMYLNERLLAEQKSASPDFLNSKEADDEVTSPGTRLPDGDFASELFQQSSADDSVRCFAHRVCRLLGGTPTVFFRYIHNRRVLMAALGEGMAETELKGLGLNLNEAEEGFRAVQLRDPEKLSSLAEMVQSVFSVEEFSAWPIEALGEIQGLICVLGPASTEARRQIEEWLRLLGKALSLSEAETRLHVVSTKDFHTDVLNRSAFLKRIQEEVSRSRRTQLPLALVTMAVDQYGQLTSLFGQDESQVVMRTAVRILEKHSRVNDIFGRTGVDELSLLLPNTSQKGAMIKAERLRRMLESADFSKVIRQFPRITMSLGVSEYPSLARDPEELMQTADEALFQVRTVGNRTCVAKAVTSFSPDFPVSEESV